MATALSKLWSGRDHYSYKFIVFLAAGLVQCRTGQPRPIEQNTVLTDSSVPTKPLESCVAIRGNGARVFAHFGALAKYHEHYKPFQGLAGSSSGSITSFLYESMMKNPLLKTCGTQPCTEEEQAIKLSFLLKSIFIYAQAFSDSDEIRALRYIFEQVNTIKANTTTKTDFVKLIKDNPDKAWDALQTVLSKDEIRPLINREIFKIIRESANPQFHLAEVQKSLEKFGKFEATDPSVFLFPGFIDWDVVAQRLGRLGDFYAGYGSYYPKNRMEQVLSQCSKAAVGKTWDQIQEIRFSESKSCQEAMIDIIGFYRTRRIKDSTGPRRIDEIPGDQQTILISTSVFTDEMKSQYQKIYLSYVKGQPVPWTPDYSGVKVGYFVTPEQAAKLQDDPIAFRGIRTNRFQALKATSWREILQTSPAEPGLSGIKTLADGNLSAGGWIDLTPVLALKAVGCQNTLLLTRPQGPSLNGFAPSVSRILGATEQQVADGSDGNPNRIPPSALSQALGAADAILCADWDTAPEWDVKAISKAGYDAKFYSNSTYWKAGKTPHPLIVPSQGRASCLAP